MIIHDHQKEVLKAYLSVTPAKPDPAQLTRIEKYLKGHPVTLIEYKESIAHTTCQRCGNNAPIRLNMNDTPYLFCKCGAQQRYTKIDGVPLREMVKKYWLEYCKNNEVNSEKYSVIFYPIVPE